MAFVRIETYSKLLIILRSTEMEEAAACLKDERCHGRGWNQAGNCLDFCPFLVNRPEPVPVIELQFMSTPQFTTVHVPLAVLSLPQPPSACLCAVPSI